MSRKKKRKDQKSKTSTGNWLKKFLKDKRASEKEASKLKITFDGTGEAQ